MDLEEFNDEVLSILMEKIGREGKNLFLLGDFNVNLMNSPYDIQTGHFFDILTSNLMVPYITLPTRITTSSTTLIDNIFSNSLNSRDGVSGNLTSKMSDHYAQFLIIASNCHKVSSKHNQYKRDTKNFDRDNFILDLLDIDIGNNIDIDKEEPNQSFNLLENELNKLLDKYMPLKKLTKSEIKQKLKPRITLGIRNSIKRRDKIYKKYIKAKNTLLKYEYHKEYKDLRNQIISLCRDSKKNIFKISLQKMQGNWQGIKSIINISATSMMTPDTLLAENKIISEPIEIANNFNNYFSSIAKKLQDNMHDSGKNYQSILKNKNANSFFINPTDPQEIISIINNINIAKATGPHSIPSNIFHLIKLIIAEPLSKIVNLSFNKGIYIENLKIAKTHI